MTGFSAASADNIVGNVRIVCPAGEVEPKSDTARGVSPRLLTTKEAAKLLGLHYVTLQKWRVRGCGPPFLRLGGRAVRYRVSDLERWMRRHTFDSTTQADVVGAEAERSAGKPARSVSR